MVDNPWRLQSAKIGGFQAGNVLFEKNVLYSKNTDPGRPDIPDEFTEEQGRFLRCVFEPA
jgi:hypothetical protein